MTHPDNDKVRDMFFKFRRAEFNYPREEAEAAVEIYHYIRGHYETQIAVLEAKLKEYQGHDEILKKLDRIEYLISNPTAVHQSSPAPHIE